MNQIIEVPEKLRPLINDSRLMIEEYFYNFFIKNNPQTDRFYLPIMWTTLYHRHPYNLDIPKKEIQSFLNTLDKNKKYFTVTIYDDGILNDIYDLDIKIFSANYIGENYYPIPLTYKFREKHNIKRDIDIFYIGHETHTIRKELEILYKDLPNCYIKNGFVDYVKFDKLMCRSIL